MSEPFIGEIHTYAFNFPPRGWALCDGQLMQVSQHTALFSLVGTTYGGDGRNTFGLPDLRGRAPVHMGTGPGLSPKDIGDRGGLEIVTLQVSQMPLHNHDASSSGFTARMLCNNGPATKDTPVNNTLAELDRSNQYTDQAPNAQMAAGTVQIDGAVTIANNGGSQPHLNMPPYLTLNFSIALLGLFPSRS